MQTLPIPTVLETSQVKHLKNYCQLYKFTLLRNEHREKKQIRVISDKVAKQCYRKKVWDPKRQQYPCHIYFRNMWGPTKNIRSSRSPHRRHIKGWGGKDHN